MKRIPVMEVFGPTIQGEGMVIGQKTMFVRTAGCDYRCSWCDSSFTWDGSGESKLMTAEEIWEMLLSTGGDKFSHVTISGGNPMLHQGLADLIDLLKQKGITTAVETQGSIWQDWVKSVDDVTISPKPPSSGMETDYERLDLYMDSLTTCQSSLKVVVFDEEDFTYAERLHTRYPEPAFYLQVGNDDVSSLDNQSLTESLLKKYEWLIDKATESAIMNDARVLPQLHSLVWGNKRGV